MVSESFDLSTTDPTMITNGSKKSYHVKKPIFWAIVSGIVAIFITLLVLTIYFGVNQKVSASKTTATTVAIAASTTTTTTTTTATATATASELIETTTLAPPIERIPT
ncbi:unnamed protein product, partial [Rotaria socialis]